MVTLSSRVFLRYVSATQDWIPSAQDIKDLTRMIRLKGSHSMKVITTKDIPATGYVTPVPHGQIRLSADRRRIGYLEIIKNPPQKTGTWYQYWETVPDHKMFALYHRITGEQRDQDDLPYTRSYSNLFI